MSGPDTPESHIDTFYPPGRGFRDYLREARGPGRIWSNGVGFLFFGRHRVSDRSLWQTTRWFVLFGLPIWPLETVLINRHSWIRIQHGWVWKRWALMVTTTRLDEPIISAPVTPTPRNRRQVLLTLVHYWGGIVCLYLLFGLLSR